MDALLQRMFEADLDVDQVEQVDEDGNFVNPAFGLA